MSYRVIVCGSREWHDRLRIQERLALLAPDTVIVNGMCPRGADRIAKEEADKLGLVTEPIPADWDGYTEEDFKLFGKKGAGRKRNEYMAALGADLCIAFWDNRSTGTYDMIQRANRHGIPAEIHDKFSSLVIGPTLDFASFPEGGPR